MPEPKADSCLITNFSHYLELVETDRQLLIFLERSERKFFAGELIYARGDRTVDLFVVKSGWLFAFTILPDGRRHVVRVYTAGDIIGLPAFAYSQHALHLEASTAGILCLFSKKALNQVFETSPRLTALLFSLVAREEVILSETLRAAIRMRPIARLAYFLLDLICRLRVTNSTMTTRFALPLTQAVIGDTMGLTNVTVSRELTAMESEGLIERFMDDIVLRDEMRMRELCDYTDRYATLDVSWFPRS